MMDKEFLKSLYEKIYKIRIFEQRCIQLYRQGDIRGYFHPYIGEEAIATGVCAALGKDDYITSTHRGHGHCIARGADIDKMTAELLGKKTGYCKGLGGSMHIADFSAGNLGANGIVGAGIPLGVGAAMGAWLRGEKSVSVVFTSDGGSNNGVFAESLNLAAIWNLPAIVVIENNQYAVSTPIEESSRQTELYKRGIGYGVESFRVEEGNNVLKVYETAQKAVELCRAGKGPVLIEAVTYRHGGHHVNDPGLYMPKERLDYYKKNDPVLISKGLLKEQGGLSDDEIAAIEKSIEEKMDQAIDFARKSPELTEAEFQKIVEVY